MEAVASGNVGTAGAPEATVRIPRYHAAGPGIPGFRMTATPPTAHGGRRRFLATMCSIAPLGVAGRAMAGAPPATGEPSGTLLQRSVGGAAVPAVGLGTWRGFDVSRREPGWAEAQSTLQRFHALGGRVVDSSPMYGMAEAALGSMAQQLGINDALFLASKVWTDGAEAGQAQLDASLQLLRREVVDLMQVHNLVDLPTQMALLRRAREEGRIRLVGISHYHAGAHDAVVAAMERHAPDVVQINYSVAEPEAAERVLPAARERGMAVLVNRPFAEGRLLSRLRSVPLPAFAAELEARSWAQLLLKWILAEDGVSVVLTGTRNPAHIEDNLAAARGPLPDPAQRRAIAAAAAA